MRGLKPIGKMMPILILVASFTDAWIETINDFRNVNAYQSHLLQMRGLKRELAAVQARQFKSHLLQMRGLKHILHDRKTQFGCRIFYRCVD